MKKIAYGCYSVFFLAFAVQLWYAMSDALTFSTTGKIVIVGIQILALVIGTVANIKTLSEKQKKHDIHFAQVIICFVFLGNLAYLLFFDSDFGRTSFEESRPLAEYIQYNVNLTPFNTINLYMDGYRFGSIPWNTMMINITGNMVAFMPFAYFLPLFFKKQRKWLIFLITMVVIVFCVEVAQVWMQSGSGDIDDLILNVGGAMTLYVFFKIPFIQKRVYGEKVSG